LLFLPIFCKIITAESILQKLGNLTQYSKFTKLLLDTKGVHTAYLENYVTVFAPSNDAMDQSKCKKDENFILHHMVSSSVNQDEMGQRLTSLMQGHPPIWTGSKQFVLESSKSEIQL